MLRKTVFTDWCYNFRSGALQLMQKYSDLKVSVLGQFMGTDQFSKYGGDILNSKMDCWDCRGTGGMPSLNQKSYSQEQGRASMNSIETLTDLGGERKKENSRGLFNSGRARTESGQNRLMQRPLSEQRQGSTTAAELVCWCVTRKKTRRRGTGGNEGDPRPYL